MFSYDDRVKAVLLYIKYDWGAAATVRDLGYPTRKRRFTADQERLAVDYYVEHGRRISATIRALGYPCRETLRQWIQERCPDIRSAATRRSELNGVFPCFLSPRLPGGLAIRGTSQRNDFVS